MKEYKKKYQNKYIFEYLKNILTTKSMNIFKTHINDSESIKSFPSVVIMRYLSMSPDPNVRNIILKNQIFLERLDKTSHENFYKWCILNIPKQYNSFIKYIK
jgi:hypothetical protein